MCEDDQKGREKLLFGDAEGSQLAGAAEGLNNGEQLATVGDKKNRATQVPG